MLWDIEGADFDLARGRCIRGIHRQAVLRALTNAGAALDALESIDGPRAPLLVDLNSMRWAAFRADAAKDAYLSVYDNMTLQSCWRGFGLRRVLNGLGLFEKPA